MTGHSEPTQYWNAYYKGQSGKRIPSQFAAFVASEFPERRNLFDFGCGTGRDTFFFAQFVENVIAVDRSTTAIAQNAEYAQEHRITNAAFHALDLSDQAACEAFAATHNDALDDAIVYGRFLLHAIPETSENNLLALIQQSIGPDGHACFEFRTDRDEFQQKETSPHYRRYISTLAFSERARDAGLKITYLTEGFGFAKMRKDDAYVARVILSKA
jgi:SAM-dependent methyltransferase